MKLYRLSNRSHTKSQDSSRLKNRKPSYNDIQAMKSFKVVSPGRDHMLIKGLSHIPKLKELERSLSKANKVPEYTDDEIIVCF